MLKDQDKLIVRAKRIARQEFKRLRESREFANCHPSHAANRALLFAEQKIGSALLGTFGVEGFGLEEFGFYNESLSYLNTGDSYDLTVCFDSRNCRFSIGSWGDFVERFSN